MAVEFIYRAEDGTEERVECYPDDPVVHPPPGALLLADNRRWRCVRAVAEPVMRPFFPQPEDDQC